MSRIRVLIVDDHALVRSGLRALLSAQPDMEVVGEVADGAAVLEPCRRLAPDVVLIDLTMPGRGGIAATEDIRHVCPNTQVLVVTMHEDETYARQALLAGATGYVLKKAVVDELIDAIREARRGRRHIAATLAQAVETPNPPTSRRQAPASAVELLTSREREVVSLLALGHTNAETAARLHVSEKTVETHRMHVLAKLSLQTRADLVRFAIEHGLMTPEYVAS
jgi:two-component system response regulator NreC